ncbi:hypothetical protein [Bacillus massiliigorillae]|uniref:hypothetical protein n=1 Tax=Bacillus massiliigorillae TaxID=1243664 RepID=UPI00039D0D66|nr:hypothetical protein [Bacillus massiliigorillae]
MSHPTAYENFKVIIEGSVYDYDLTGDIVVVNRSEIIDLSTLARRYEIQFVLPNCDYIIGSIIVDASLAHLAEELLLNNEDHAAANIEMHFLFKTKQSQTIESIKSVTDCLFNVWGRDRFIETFSTEEYHNGEYKSSSQKIVVSFNRVVTENQADDLYELVNYVITSLEEMQKQGIPFVK